MSAGCCENSAKGMTRKTAVQSHLIDKGRHLDAVQFTAGATQERATSHRLG